MALALLGLSVASALSAANNPWSHPWLYRLMEARGWIDYSTPPPQLDHPLQTWLGTLPSPAPNTSYTARYTSDGLPADQFRLALLPGEGDPILRIEAPTVGLDRFEATVNRERLEAGQPPAKFLTPLTGSEADLPRAARFLQGTPTPVAYRARRYQYLHLRFRADAYRCLQASATASQRTPPRRHRCDVWLTPDIPFGPAKVQTSVTDARSGQVLSRRTWTLWQRGTVTADSTNK